MPIAPLPRRGGRPNRKALREFEDRLPALVADADQEPRVVGVDVRRDEGECVGADSEVRSQPRRVVAPSIQREESLPLVGLKRTCDCPRERREIATAKRRPIRGCDEVE